MKLARSARLAVGLFAVPLAATLVADEQRTNAPGATAARGKVDLNTASRKQLEAVAVIGPDLAPAIIAARPFATIDELDRVQGISAERLEQIRAHAHVAPQIAKNRLGEPNQEKKPLGTPERAANRAGRIDLNAASEKELAAVPVIGPELAREIVRARPFGSLDELVRLKGLNAERLEQIRAVVTIPPARTGGSLP